jgi:hypothetical protein
MWLCSFKMDWTILKYNNAKFFFFKTFKEVVQRLLMLVAGVLLSVTKVKTNLMEFEYNHLLKLAL